MLRIRMLKRLSDYLDQGITQVSVAEMLDLLDPKYVPRVTGSPDPRADPLTGAMPVLPEAYRGPPPLAGAVPVLPGAGGNPPP